MSINYGHQKMFDTRKGLDCLPETETAPKKERLFGEFFYKNELAVLCGPEGSGRSILAMQIADSISRGVPLGEFGLDTGARPVVFLDIEGNHDEFARRYSLDGKQPYPFHDNFNIVRFHQNFRGYTSMRKDFLKELNTTVARHKEGVLIINNLDYWKCFMPEAYALAAIKELQANSRLSVLLISSLKGSPARKQLTPNRAGKLVTTMTDSIFAMNFSQKGADTRYLLQLKTKGGKPVYHPNHVAEFTLGKQHNFTGCRFTGFGTEQEHIAMPPTDFEMKIIELSLNKPELRLAEIADQLKTNKVRVDRVLKKFDAKEVKRMGTLGTLVTSTFENENSDTEILNSKSTFAEATADEEGHGSTILCHAEAEGGLEARQRIVGTEVVSVETLDTLVTSTLKNGNSNIEILNSKSTFAEATANEENNSSPCPLLSLTTPAQGGQPHAEPETLEGLVTSAFENENSNTEILNSNSAFAEASAEESTDSRLRGNDSPPRVETPTPLLFDPVKWKYKPSERPYPPVVNQSPEELAEAFKTLDTMITSHCKNKSPSKTPKDEEEPKPTFSQRVKKQIAQNNVKRLRGK